MKPLLKNLPHNGGFTLIELTIGIIIIGLFTAGAASSYSLYIKKKLMDDTRATVDSLAEGLASFQKTHGRLPCPASLEAAPDSADYGREVDCNGNAHAGTKVASGRENFKVRIGTVPTRSMDLPDRMMTDAYGRRITYAVTEVLADSDLSNDSDYGAIFLEDSKGNSVTETPGTARYVLFSHGLDGKGAHTADGVPYLPCFPDATDSQNCNNTAVFVLTRTSHGESSSYFDDVLAYNVFPGETSPAWPTGTCEDGQILVGFDASGELICEEPRDRPVLCPPNHMLRGFTSDGEPDCREVRLQTTNASERFGNGDLNRAVSCPDDWTRTGCVTRCIGKQAYDIDDMDLQSVNPNGCKVGDGIKCNSSDPQPILVQAICARTTTARTEQ